MVKILTCNYFQILKSKFAEIGKNKKPYSIIKFDDEIQSIMRIFEYSKTPIYRAPRGRGFRPGISGPGKSGFYCIIPKTIMMDLTVNLSP